MTPHELDVVELTERVGRWEAGESGTVVEAHEEGAVVEFVDTQGQPLEFLRVPYDALAVTETHSKTETYSNGRGR